MMDCLFCKIAQGKIPSTKIYEDERFFAFKDIAPQAPVHFLVIPKQHIESLDKVTEEDAKLLADAMLFIARLAREQGLDKTGYRVVNNMGDDGGQTVKHLHFHILGGRSLQWPPG